MHLALFVCIIILLMKIWKYEFNIDKTRNYINKRLIFYIAIVSILSLCSLIPSFNFLLDIVSQFKIQYFIFGIIALLYLVLANIKDFTKLVRTGIFLSLLIIIINFVDIYKDLIPYKSHGQGNLRVAHFNVLTKNKSYDKVLLQIQKKNPNVILIEELDATWLNNIKEIQKNYPYSIVELRDDNFGIAMFSQIPLVNPKIEYWTDWEVPVIISDLKIGSEISTIIGIHTLPPIKDYIERRNLMLDNLSKKISENPENILILGDLNTSKYSYAYKTFIMNSKIKNAQDGFGCNGTWNAMFLPFFRISLDHILYGGNFEVKDFKILDKIGSDHLPSVAEFIYIE